MLQRGTLVAFPGGISWWHFQALPDLPRWRPWIKPHFPQPSSTPAPDGSCAGSPGLPGEQSPPWIPELGAGMVPWPRQHPPQQSWRLLVALVCAGHGAGAAPRSCSAGLGRVPDRNTPKARGSGTGALCDPQEGQQRAAGTGVLPKTQRGHIPEQGRGRGPKTFRGWVGLAARPRPQPEPLRCSLGPKHPEQPEVLGGTCAPSSSSSTCRELRRALLRDRRIWRHPAHPEPSASP